MPSLTVRVVSAVVLSVALSTSQALACTFHQIGFGTPFEATYPGSLKVAAAVAQARADGRLSETQIESGYLGLQRASRAMAKIGNRLDRASGAGVTDFSVILAGQQLWTQYAANIGAARKAYRVNFHTAAPVRDTPVVVTSYYVVFALLDGSLPISEAIDSGLVLIHRDTTGQVATLLTSAFSQKQAAR